MIRYLFWVSILFIVYTYLLYPLLIVLASKLKNRPPVPDIADTNYPSITMIIVVCNEEKVILDKLENCRNLDYPAEKIQICIVSDGSTDGTAEILRNQEDILFIEDDVNKGKPHQINTAIERCESDLIVFSDARQMYKVDSLSKLARNFVDSDIGAVSGDLTFISADDATERSVGLYWNYEKMLRKAESNVASTLGVTGAIYAMRRSLVEPIPYDTVLDDIEIPLRAFRQGYRIVFDKEALAYDVASSRIEAEFRRKARTLAGNFQLFARNPWLLNPVKNRIFLQTVSHKLFRLFVPYFMILMLITTFVAEGSVFKLLFWSQMAFYALGMAALGSGMLRRIRLINFISVFITLNSASVYALFIYVFKKADARWKQ
jgi:biofilm PGA synthesis N-glycosyltransferase PgaC